MVKSNLRKKIVLVALIFFGSLFFLFSCKKEDPLPDSLFINSYPTKVVYRSLEDIPSGTPSGLEVLGIYNGGSTSIISPSSYDGPTQIGVDDNESHPGLTIRYYQVRHQNKKELTAVYPIIINPNYQEVGGVPVQLENADPILFSTKVINSFSYNLGHEFDNNSILKKVYFTDGTTNFDRGINIESAYTIEYLKDGVSYSDTTSGVLRKVILRGGVYEVRYNINVLGTNMQREIPVIVAGGDAPIHLKYGTSAQWFDYILVIWIAFIMNYTSFGVFALGILFTTIIVRTMAWPIYANSNNMSFKMALANPDIQKIEEKYRGRTDKFSSQQKQQETMKVYKKHGIKFTGCLLMILQLPIFTAMWQVVRRITIVGGMFANSINDSKAFGVENFLSSGTSSWSFSHIFLVVIMAITYIALMLVGQMKPGYVKKTSSHHKSVATKQPAKPGGMGGGMGKMMVWVMTVVMIFMAFSNNNALTFYWIVGNLYSLFQTILMRHLNARKYRLIQVKSSIGSLYDDLYQRKASYKQLVIDEVENAYLDTKDKIANPTTNSKLKTFFNKAIAIVVLTPLNFFRKYGLEFRRKSLTKFKNQHTLIGGKAGGKE